MTRYLFIGLLLGVGFTSAVVYSGILSDEYGPLLAGASESEDDTPATETPEPVSIFARGRIRPAAGILKLSVPPGLLVHDIPPGVEPGASVTTEQPLIVFDSAEVDEKIRVADSQLRQLTAMRDASLAAGSAGVELAELAVRTAEEIEANREQPDSQIELLSQTLDAQRELLRKMEANPSDVPSSTLEQQRLAVRQAETQLKAARDEVASAVGRTKLELTLAKRKLDATRAEFDLKIAQVEQERKLLLFQKERLALKSPSDGVVLEVGVAVGERAGPTPVVRLADVSTMLCVAEVDGPGRARIREGGQAVVTSRAFPTKKLSGTVSYVSPSIAAPALPSFDPTELQDRQVFEVEVTLDADSSSVAADFIGLAVEVEFPVSGSE